MNLGYIGDKGQGKSYLLAKKLVAVLHENRKWHEQTGLPIRQVLVMNTLGLSDEFVQDWNQRHDCEQKCNKPYIVFFDEIKELSDFTESDVFVDDISMRLDSRNWDLLPQASREWLYGAERLGCDLYFTAQKFSRVEITFRLLTDKIFLCTKGIGSRRPSATRPEVKRIWGIIYACDIPKSEFQKESFNQDEYNGGRMHWLSKKYTSVYDHTNISLSKGYPPLQAIVRECNNESCPKAPHVIIKHV